MKKNRLESQLEQAQHSQAGMVLQVLSWSTLVFCFGAFTILSLVGDMTPIPLDGTFFGELAGAFLMGIILKGRNAIVGKDS